MRLVYFCSSTKLEVHFAIVMVLFQVGCMYPQAEENTSLFYNWFDEKIGIENSGLYNGSVYTERFNVVNEKHQFFNSPELSLGSVTYDGQTYFDQKIQYDLYNDALLITPKNRSSVLLIVLEPSKTEGFSIEGRPFIRRDETIQGSTNAMGFCEKISGNDMHLLVKKYRKSKTDKRGTNFVYQEFDQDINYFVLLNNTFYPVNSRREWMLAFPNFKKAIKDFYQEYNEIRKKDMDTFLAYVLEHLSSSGDGQPTSF